MKGKKVLWELFRRRYGKVWIVGTYKRKDGTILPVLCANPLDLSECLDDDFCGEFSPEGILLSGSGRYGHDGELLLSKAEFSYVRDIIRYWRSNKNSWAGYISCGYLGGGYMGEEYYAPNSEKPKLIKKEEVSLKRRSLPCNEKRGRLTILLNNTINREMSGQTLLAGNIKANLERFEIELSKGNSKKPFPIWQFDIPVLEEFIRLYPQIELDFWSKA